VGWAKWYQNSEVMSVCKAGVLRTLLKYLLCYEQVFHNIMTVKLVNMFAALWASLPFLALTMA